MCLGTFLVTSVGLLIFVGLQPWGWLLDLAGVPAWLGVRWVFFGLRGSETGTFAVDEQGVIRVLGGHGGIRRLVRLYDVGAGRWLGGAVASGVVMFVVILGVPVTLGVALDALWIMLVFMTMLCVGMLDGVRYFVVRQLKLRSSRLRLLDGNAMLPALALYARHHGVRAAVSGVPADRLAATIAAHPEDKAIAANYAAGLALLSRLAFVASSAAGGASLFR